MEQNCNLIAKIPTGAPHWSTAGGVFVQGLRSRK